MSLTHALETGIDNYANCMKSIRYSVLLLVIGIVLQINGFTGRSWSSSPTSFHGMLSLCHQSDQFTCCDRFETEWMTAVFVFQCLGLVFALPTVVCAILFTCVSRTKGTKGIRKALQLVSLLTALFIGVSGAIYSSSYWKNHILADHHLSTSFTTVILACLAYLITCMIISLNNVTVDDEEAPLLQSTDGPPVNCVVCMDRRPNVRFNCNHVVCCMECADRLQTSDNYSCPVCRTPITHQRHV